MNNPATIEDLRNALHKVLSKGVLHRMPKHPGNRNLLLAVLSLPLVRRYPYTEVELNHELSDTLAQLNAIVDHVTCRRYMVDLGFVKRDRAGSRYYLNYPKLESTLSGNAIEQAPQVVDEVIFEQSQPKKSLEQWQQSRETK